MGSFARKMTDEERKIFQELVDEGFTQFKDAIKQGRPKFRKDPAALDKLATGQVFTAEQALENGLIDKIGFIEDAIDRAIRLAGLDKENVKVVKYKAEPRLSDLLFGQSRVQPSLDLAALLDSHDSPRLLPLHLASRAGRRPKVRHGGGMETATRREIETGTARSARHSGTPSGSARPPGLENS